MRRSCLVLVLAACGHPTPPGRAARATPSATTATIPSVPSDAGPATAASAVPSLIPGSKRPDLVLPTGTDVQILLTCTDLDAHTEAVSCDEEQCVLRYVASRVESSPAGYRIVARDAGVDRTLPLGHGRGRVAIYRRRDAVHVRIELRGAEVLRFDGRRSGQVATEASSSEELFGVLSTPGAETRALAAASAGGASPTPVATRDEYRAGAKCVLNVDPHAE